jgi:two-component system OmpR family sensor kinase
MVGKIIFKSEPLQDGLKIEIIDEGSGIDESLDLFAPFKRAGKKSGVGLGLFLAKSAADALGAKISIKNRKDRQGAVATLILPLTLVCPIKQKL